MNLKILITVKKTFSSALLSLPTFAFAQSDELVGLFFASIIFFVLGIIITRWIFGIPTIINLLKRQTDLLILIAKQNETDDKTKVKGVLGAFGDDYAPRAEMVYNLSKTKKQVVGDEENSMQD